MTDAAVRLDVLSAWAIVKSEEPLLGWKKECIDSHNKGRNGPHNSVSVVIVLYLTVCT